MKPPVVDFVNRSFRDVADKDYVAARVLYRHGLDQQFLWASLQTIEKYLKAILLFNGRSVKALGHDIDRALDAVLDLKDLDLDLPADAVAFVRYLAEYGSDRYFERPFHTKGEELAELDRTVWYLRRYCQYLRGQVKRGDGSSLDLFPVMLKSIHAAPRSTNRHRFRILGGFLERTLEKRDSSLRQQLVRKNFYYGARKRNVIASFPMRMSSAIPTHFARPEIFGELSHLVTFSKEVREYFATLGKERPRGAV